jgi:hypothetical protein
VQGATPEKDTIEKAHKEGIPILISELPEFEVVGSLYQMIYFGQG